MRIFLSIICLTFLAISANTSVGKVHSIASSRNLITGENCYITFVIEASSRSMSPPIRTKIQVDGAFFQLYDTNVMLQRGKRYYSLVYRFNSPNPGTFTIPSTTFTPENPSNISDPLTLTVRDKKTLTKKEVNSKDVKNPRGPIRKTYTYFTQLIADKSSLFPNEPTRLEYKIYIPRSINVAQWGLPTGEKKNATAWRFETPDIRAINGDVVINGQKYQVGRFHTTVSGTKHGKAIIGPFKARIVHHASMISRLGVFIETQEIFPLSDSLELNILELPPNPPADFKGDVGNFQMSVQIESKTQLRTTESIKAEVSLYGRGKFSEITPPSLTNAEHWKLISESKRDLGKLRKNINAFAQFSYLIQPKNTGPATSTPGFSFSYLDPDLKTYRTLTHPGVPVSIILESSPDSVTMPDSSEQMSGIITGAKISPRPWYKNSPLQRALVHIIPATLCVLLLLRYAFQKRQAYRLKQSHQIIQRKSLIDLEAKEGESFLKAASNYIQRWVNTEEHSELKDIQQLRDDHCYKPDHPIKLSAKRKNAIIDTLKKLTILLFFISPQLSDASAETLWKNEKYQKALTEFQSQLPAESPDILYNIGSCHHKLNQPGNAAVFYHRALLLDPYHSRAKHNLSLLQKQHNSIISTSYIQDGSLQDWIRIISLNTYYIIFSLSLWLILLAFLYVKIIKPKKNSIILTLGIIAVIIAPLSGYAYFEHPDKETLLESTLAIITKSTALKEQPISNSSTITTATPASECNILITRGTYTYIQLTDHTKTKGWINSDHLLRVIE